MAPATPTARLSNLLQIATISEIQQNIYGFKIRIQIKIQTRWRPQPLQYVCFNLKSYLL